MSHIAIPDRVSAACASDPERSAWLRELPAVIRRLEAEWSISVEAPFDAGFEVTCAWVARATRRDGAAAVLKLGMPHMEALHEIEGLRFWSGDPTVHLLASERATNAMLIEICEPGTSLRRLPEQEQDAVIGGLLRRVWRAPGPDLPFRPLSAMTDHWHAEAAGRPPPGGDAGLLAEGLDQLDELARSGSASALLATDLHAGNVLAARREPWLVIDPKPFVGDPAYDATQHLLNCAERVLADPESAIGRFADLLEVDRSRVRSWLFARVASGLGGGGPTHLQLARVLGE